MSMYRSTKCLEGGVFLLHIIAYICRLNIDLPQIIYQLIEPGSFIGTCDQFITGTGTRVKKIRGYYTELDNQFLFTQKY